MRSRLTTSSALMSQTRPSSPTGTARQNFLYGTDRPATYEQTTHEIRVSWDNDGPINAVIGGYLWDSEYEIPLRSWVGFVVPGVILDLLQNSRQESESQAVLPTLTGACRTT